MTPGDGSIAVEWTAPASDGGAPIASYLVTAYSGSNPLGTTCTAVAPSTSCDLTGLTNDDPHFIVVQAINVAGSGSPSSVVFATPVAPVPPAAPTGLLATPGDAQVELAWNSVADAVSYRVFVDGELLVTPVITGTSFVVTGLVNGQSYDFAVAAVDAADLQSVLSDVVPATPTGSVPVDPPLTLLNVSAVPGLVVCWWIGMHR